MSCHALVIALDGSPAEGYAELKGRKATAERICQALVVNGYPDTNIRSLFDENATKERIQESLAELAEQKPSVLLLYFTGHGVSVKLAGGETTPALIVRSNPHVAEYDIVDLIGDLKATYARHVVVLLDACYSADVSLERVMEATKGINNLTLCAAARGLAYESAETGKSTFSEEVLRSMLTHGLSQSRSLSMTAPLFVHALKANVEAANRAAGLSSRPNYIAGPEWPIGWSIRAYLEQTHLLQDIRSYGGPCLPGLVEALLEKSDEPRQGSIRAQLLALICRFGLSCYDPSTNSHRGSSFAAIAQRICNEFRALLQTVITDAVSIHRSVSETDLDDADKELSARMYYYALLEASPRECSEVIATLRSFLIYEGDDAKTMLDRVRQSIRVLDMAMEMPVDLRVRAIDLQGRTILVPIVAKGEPLVQGLQYGRTFRLQDGQSVAYVEVHALSNVGAESRWFLARRWRLPDGSRAGQARVSMERDVYGRLKVALTVDDQVLGVVEDSGLDDMHGKGPPGKGPPGKGPPGKGPPGKGPPPDTSDDVDLDVDKVAAWKFLLSAFRECSRALSRVSLHDPRRSTLQAAVDQLAKFIGDGRTRHRRSVMNDAVSVAMRTMTNVTTIIMEMRNEGLLPSSPAAPAAEALNNLTELVARIRRDAPDVDPKALSFVNHVVRALRLLLPAEGVSVQALEEAVKQLRDAGTILGAHTSIDEKVIGHYLSELERLAAAAQRTVESSKTAKQAIAEVVLGLQRLGASGLAIMGQVILKSFDLNEETRRAFEVAVSEWEQWDEKFEKGLRELADSVVRRAGARKAAESGSDSERFRAIVQATIVKGLLGRSKPEDVATELLEGAVPPEYVLGEVEHIVSAMLESPLTNDSEKERLKVWSQAMYNWRIKGISFHDLAKSDAEDIAKLHPRERDIERVPTEQFGGGAGSGGPWARSIWQPSYDGELLIAGPESKVETTVLLSSK